MKFQNQARRMMTIVILRSVFCSTCWRNTRGHTKAQKDPTGTKKPLSQVLVHGHDCLSINIQKKVIKAQESSCPTALFPSIFSHCGVSLCATIFLPHGCAS